MNGPKIVELTYANGKIYKECIKVNVGNNTVKSKRIEDECVSKYHTSDSKFLDKNYPFFATKEYANGDIGVKYYYPSTEIYKLVKGVNSKNDGKDLSVYDLAPDVELWIGIGIYKDKSDSYDLIFAVDNDKQLKSISEYYNLDYPLPKNKSLDIISDDWHSFDFDIFCNKVNPNCDSSFRKDFKYGSVKFKKNKPCLLKMYESNYKDKNYAH
jgi:hypothetical protein